MQKPSTGEIVFFWTLFLIGGVFTFLIFSPYITSLFLALVLVIIFSPVNQQLIKMTHGRKGVAAGVAALLVATLVLIPFIFAGILLFREAINTYGTPTTHGGGGVGVIDHYMHYIELFIQKYVPSFTLENSVEQYLGTVLGFVAKNLNTVFSQIVSLFFHLIIMMIATFLFFRHGDSLRASIVRWSPLNDTYDVGILDRIGLAVGSVVKGSILLALIQGALTGLGFYIFNITNPVLWGVVGVFAALVPSLGTAIVNIPAIAYLFIAGDTVHGIGLLVWGIGFVGTIDNVLRPILIQRGIKMHPFIIFLSVLGGLVYFGPIGFIAGPVIIAFFFALSEIYPHLISGKTIPEISTTETPE